MRTRDLIAVGVAAVALFAGIAYWIALTAVALEWWLG